LQNPNIGLTRSISARTKRVTSYLHGQNVYLPNGTPTVSATICANTVSAP
jgi:hypothetical protein